VIKVEDPTATLPPHPSDESTATHDEQPSGNEFPRGEAFYGEYREHESSSDKSLDDISDEVSSDNDSDNSENQRKAAFISRRATKAFYLMPRRAPREVFVHSATEHPSRMIRRDNPDKEILIYTSSQYFGRNTKQNIPACAGCAVIIVSVDQEGVKSLRFPLEQNGPTGLRHNLGQKTAELRALVAALELKDWSTEGWEKVIIATSSTFIYRKITQSMGVWDSQW
jgi:hypothetical protein